MHGILQNGTKERSVRLATQFFKESELRGQIIESYQSPKDSLNIASNMQYISMISACIFCSHNEMKNKFKKNMYYPFWATIEYTRLSTMAG